MKEKDAAFENLFRKVAFQDDEQAFKELFLEFYPAMCVFAMRYITQEETAYLRKQEVENRYMENSGLSAIHPSPEEVYTLKELESAISEALAKLPSNVREAFEMNRYKGMTYVAIAEKMEVSPKTIEAYISKALKVLRIELQDYLPFLLLFL